MDFHRHSCPWALSHVNFSPLQDDSFQKDKTITL